MREILYRGKNYIGEWIEGAYYKQTEYYGCDYEAHIIITTKDELEDNMMTFYRVFPETVGQYTGLTDKNGTKIFEGDIVKATFSYNNFTQDRVERRTATYEVRYNEKYCYFYLAKHQNNMLFDGNWTYSLREIEVIGNIHDNPELLEGGMK